MNRIDSIKTSSSSMILSKQRIDDHGQECLRVRLYKNPLSTPKSN